MFKPKLLTVRRRLLATLVLLAGLVAVSYFANHQITAGVGTTTAVVSVSATPTETPNDEQIDAAVREAVALAGGLPAGIGPGKKIVIQPNLVQAGWQPGSGVVPNDQVVKTVIKMCAELGATADDITVCEGSASYRDGTSWGGYSDREMTIKAFKDCGLDPDSDMWVEDDDHPTPSLRSHIARCVDANDVGQAYPDYPNYQGGYNANYVTRITRPNYLINRAYYVPNCVAQCDYLIRIPALKSHELAGTTGALKLAYGFGPTDIYHLGGYNYYKYNLLHQEAWGYGESETNARGMADMTLARPPDFIVLDGLVGVINGPVGSAGQVQTPAAGKMHCIMASTDPVAIDTIQTLAMGYKTDSIPGLAKANQVGLGQNNPAFIQVKGLHVKDVRRWFPQWVKQNRYPGVGLPGDQNPPTMSGLNLSGTTHLWGDLSVTPTSPADTDPGLCKGELFVDGVAVDSTGTSPYKTTWTTAGWAAGSYTVTYTIYDKMYNEASLDRTVVLHTGDPIAEALALPDGSVVSLGQVHYMGKAPGIDGNTFFVSSPDGLRGLRVRYSTTVPTISLGRFVTLTGTLATVGGQRYIECTGYTSHLQATAPKPRFLSNLSAGGADRNNYTRGVSGGIGPNNLGLLVKVAGKVSAGGSDHFYISDGSLSMANSGTTKLKVKCGTIGQPAVGSFVSVTGFSCCENDAGTIRRFLAIRSSTDWTQLKAP